MWARQLVWAATRGPYQTVHRPSARLAHGSATGQAPEPEPEPELQSKPELEPWWKAGLRFSCTECGQCCTGAPGVVYFEPAEGAEMAAALDLSLTEFYSAHARLVRGKYSLKETIVEGHGHDCEFLDRTSAPGRALCRVHSARPQQCISWPFWPRVLASKEVWEEEAADCPGIENGLKDIGELHSARTIAEQARLDQIAADNTAPR